MHVNEIADDLSDLDLLSAALQDAVTAHREGLIVGPGLDEVALRRAERRARRRDLARLAELVPAAPGGAA